MSDPDPPRYHLVLAIHGRPTMQGWWASRATADHKMVSWIGERGSIPGASVTLTDETDGRQLAAWP
ncbi:hypothetical protein [Streptomyces sp. V1I6]|uniref:hypothetical protein n=1 Tax=Streptomyces sp. V1I6 TaxID=3042273 RepID=UPI0027859987|nr:hypothetical protein [Streptomyces sp. V1I6]MDQ0842380.1 hypothetical protein [Streptomyces sp. V1I6]